MILMVSVSNVSREHTLRESNMACWKIPPGIDESPAESPFTLAVKLQCLTARGHFNSLYYL